MINYSKKENWNVTEDPIITSTDEHEQKLCFAIWDQIEFLSEIIGIDDPQEIIDMIREYVEEYISEYSPADESFEEFED